MADVALKNVNKRYGAMQVVHGFDLDIAHKEFVVLVGPSGCGKSTTLRMIAGLEEISDGDDPIGDRVVNDLPPRDAQHLDGLPELRALPAHDVRKNQGFGLRMLRGMKKDEIRPTWAIAAEPARALAGCSTGARGAVGRAAAARGAGAGDRARAAVFLFDEPLSNLDAKLRGQMRTEIKKLHTKVRTTVIYVTHDQVEAMTLADRIVVMRDGLIEQVGTPDEVYHAPASRFVAGFIGSPPMNLVETRIEASTDGGVGVPLSSGPVLPIDTGATGDVAPGRPVTLGLRPEAIAPESMAGPMTRPFTFKADITLVEPLGGEALLFLRAGEAELIARVFRPNTRLVPEKDVTFVTDLAEMHLFDADTEVRLDAAAPDRMGRPA